MWQAIAAVIGIGDGANKGAQAQLAAQQAANENSLNYSRSKVISIYSQDQQTMLLFGGLGIVLAVVIAIMVFKK